MHSPPSPQGGFVYNRTSGVLYYDYNGNAADGAIAFAILTNKPVLAANDFAVI